MKPNPSFPPNRRGNHPRSLLVALALASASALQADVVIDASVTPLGGSFRYDIAVTNNESEDLAIVSFADAPGADPLIEPSLYVPLGFVASYDGVLGFLDFLSDTAAFPPGVRVGGFRFESLSGPGQFFNTIEALTINGNAVGGIVNTTVVPEGNTIAGAAVLAGLAAAAVRQRAKRSAVPNQTHTT